ncbi:hypothetical protein B0T14DRAFT_26234 [Immersiella caudata]|uniref:F-box domain-containing protein n=1 Tax=Immersiella caudata TaxID=314043 RepID=A0AA40CCA2_9PEZI|nr:hypothetical protein B0T14DRAFT_26234 [Immersiella caudata]
MGIVKHGEGEVTTKPQVGILNLPPELFLLIFEFMPLDYPTAIELQAVCRTFYHMTHVETCCTRDDKIAHMVHAEQTFQRHQRANGGKWACFKCFRLLPRQDFGKRQISSRRDKGQVDARRRFCVPRGIHRHHYGPGQIVELAGKNDWGSPE